MAWGPGSGRTRMPTSSSAARWRTAACSTCTALARSSPLGCAGDRAARIVFDPPGNLQVLLQTGQRHEDGAHLALLWPQRELADGGARQHPAHGDAHRAAQVFLARVQRLDRNRRRTLQPDQQRGAVTDGKLGSQRGAQECVPVGRTAHRLHLVEAPEAIVHAVDRHAADTLAAVLRGHETLRHHQRHERRESRRGGAVGGDILAQGLAEERGRHHGVVGPAQPIGDERPEAGPHGLADDERAGQHRHGGGHAQHHGQIGAPVVNQAAEGQVVALHPQDRSSREPGAAPSLHVPAQAVHLGEPQAAQPHRRPPGARTVAAIHDDGGVGWHRGRQRRPAAGPERQVARTGHTAAGEFPRRTHVEDDRTLARGDERRQLGAGDSHAPIGQTG